MAFQSGALPVRSERSKHGHALPSADLDPSSGDYVELAQRRAAAVAVHEDPPSDRRASHDQPSQRTAKTVK